MITMSVSKLTVKECDVVNRMGSFWLDDDEIETHSGFTVSQIEDVLTSLPYVEPKHRSIVSLMFSFFEGDEEMIPQDVYDSFLVEFSQ